ncbi:unnamed protein product, partial [Amoebophrya sp. A25]
KSYSKEATSGQKPRVSRGYFNPADAVSLKDQHVLSAETNLKEQGHAAGSSPFVGDEDPQDINMERIQVRSGGLETAPPASPRISVQQMGPIVSNSVDIESSYVHFTSAKSGKDRSSYRGSIASINGIDFEPNAAPLRLSTGTVATVFSSPRGRDSDLPGFSFFMPSRTSQGVRIADGGIMVSDSEMSSASHVPPEATPSSPPVGVGMRHSSSTDFNFSTQDAAARRVENGKQNKVKNLNSSFRSKNNRQTVNFRRVDEEEEELVEFYDNGAVGNVQELANLYDRSSARGVTERKTTSYIARRSTATRATRSDRRSVAASRASDRGKNNAAQGLFGQNWFCWYPEGEDLVDQHANSK